MHSKTLLECIPYCYAPTPGIAISCMIYRQLCALYRCRRSPVLWYRTYQIPVHTPITVIIPRIQPYSPVTPLSPTRPYRLICQHSLHHVLSPSALYLSTVNPSLSDFILLQLGHFLRVDSPCILIRSLCICSGVRAALRAFVFCDLVSSLSSMLL